MHELGSHDFQAGSFEAGVNLADDVLGDSVRLDDGESAFDSHGSPSMMILGAVQYEQSL
jgi:hypothetical protein